MPHELGDEEGQTGYYERRYPANGEWQDDSYGNLNPTGDKGPLVEKVLKNYRNKDKIKWQS